MGTTPYPNTSSTPVSDAVCKVDLRRSHSRKGSMLFAQYQMHASLTVYSGLMDNSPATLGQVCSSGPRSARGCLQLRLPQCYPSPSAPQPGWPLPPRSASGTEWHHRFPTDRVRLPARKASSHKCGVPTAPLQSSLAAVGWSGWRWPPQPLGQPFLEPFRGPLPLPALCSMK